MASSVKRSDSLPHSHDCVYSVSLLIDVATKGSLARARSVKTGSVSTHYLRCGRIFSDGIIANFILILTVKLLRKSVNI